MNQRLLEISVPMIIKRKFDQNRKYVNSLSSRYFSSIFQSSQDSYIFLGLFVPFLPTVPLELVPQ